MPNFKNIIFDLDGTLIDSAKGIIFSLNEAVKKIDLNPVIDISPEIIGPPLPNLIEKIWGDTISLQDKQLAIKVFKYSYDSVGYKKTETFPRIEKLLSEAQSRGIDLYIVTNKRDSVSRKIIKQLNWNHIFREIYCIDTFGEMYPSKRHLLNKLLIDFNLQPNECIYVGDTAEDKNASESNGVRFYPAYWNKIAFPDNEGDPATFFSS